MDVLRAHVDAYLQQCWNESQQRGSHTINVHYYCTVIQGKFNLTRETAFQCAVEFRDQQIREKNLIQLIKG